MNKESETELISLSTNLGEAALDSLLKDGLFKDIPVIGSLLSIGKLTKSVCDILLLKRILIFINELHIKDQRDIDELKEKYFKDEDFQEIGSKILFLLERADDAKKIGWQAKLFRIYLDGKISKSKYMRLSSLIANSFAPDAEQISIFLNKKSITSNNGRIDHYVLEHLFSIGLISNAGFDGGDAAGNNSGVIYQLNDFGKIFLYQVLRSQNSPN
ncbi:hypothetical protein KK062_23555 [Fulvivirgaceae bacterium PWU5]|uniref:Uncharacterized protein n=1 Tax=Dawidia cretensis TaxID=2782350 RepID=A0AAP2E1G5_9BACT|nr:hypothetical protein [Dawidia cretensis]MBT1711241.1 hypothetical protein [Dawidia cretensis]